MSKENILFNVVNNIVDNSYIKVKKDDDICFGGSQAWLYDYKKILGDYGCGVVGMADIELYVSEKRNITKEEYISYIGELYKKRYKFSTPIGLLPWRMEKSFSKFLKGLGIVKKAKWRWRYSKHFNLESIKRMLDMNVPVMVAYNRLFKKDKNLLTMYSFNENNELVYCSGCYSHFFVVTGIITLNKNEDVYLVVSSYGEKQYVKYTDFLRGDMFSGMLLIK